MTNPIHADRLSDAELNELGIRALAGAAYPSTSLAAADVTLAAHLLSNAAPGLGWTLAHQRVLAIKGTLVQTAHAAIVADGSLAPAVPGLKPEEQAAHQLSDAAVRCELKVSDPITMTPARALAQELAGQCEIEADLVKALSVRGFPLERALSLARSAFDKLPAPARRTSRTTGAHSESQKAPTADRTLNEGPSGGYRGASSQVRLVKRGCR